MDKDVDWKLCEGRQEAMVFANRFGFLADISPGRPHATTRKLCPRIKRSPESPQLIAIDKKTQGRMILRRRGQEVDYRRGSPILVGS